MRVIIETPFDCKYANAAMPDDVDLPPGMEIRHVCVDGRWRIEIEHEVKKPEDLLTLKNTLDELIRVFQIIEKV